MRTWMSGRTWRLSRNSGSWWEQGTNHIQPLSIHVLSMATCSRPNSTRTLSDLKAVSHLTVICLLSEYILQNHIIINIYTEFICYCAFEVIILPAAQDQTNITAWLTPFLPSISFHFSFKLTASDYMETGVSLAFRTCCYKFLILIKRNEKVIGKLEGTHRVWTHTVRYCC